MSQDMFAEELFDADAEDSDPDNPTEFSGVSGSATSSSPGSQPVMAPPIHLAPPAPPPTPPAPAQPGPSSSPNQGFPCPQCKKVLKTKGGFKGHMVRFHPDVAAAPLPFSSATTTAAHVSEPAIPVPSPVPKAAAPQVQQFPCPDCKKVLTTRGGFTRHRAAHKLKELSHRIPTLAQFKEEALTSIVNTVIEEILTEPTYGDNQEDCPKVKFLKNLQETESPFVQELALIICAVVCSRQKKIFPANQYEDAQKWLNSYLNEHDITLKDKMLSSCNIQVENSLARRLVFRIATKLLRKIQIWMWQKLRTTQRQTVEDCGFEPLSEVEEEAFRNALGDLLRNYFKKGMESGSERRHKQSECIKNTFVDGQHPIRQKVFLNKNNWFSKDNQCIVPSNNAVNFFKALHNEVLPVVESFEVQEVLEIVLGNVEMLENWYNLTNAFFSEDLSLLFMRELVASYLRIAASLEQKKRNRMVEKDTNATAVALRPNLKRNYVETEVHEEESVE